jgi:hypothetical protein
MTRGELLAIVMRRTEELITRLQTKNARYSQDPLDALANFRIMAESEEDTPKEALYACLTKHTAHLRKMIKSNITEYTMPEWIETLGDIAVYMLLLEAIIIEEKAHD